MIGGGNSADRCRPGLLLKKDSAREMEPAVAGKGRERVHALSSSERDKVGLSRDNCFIKVDCEFARLPAEFTLTNPTRLGITDGSELDSGKVRELRRNFSISASFSL